MVLKLSALVMQRNITITELILVNVNSEILMEKYIADLEV